MPNGVTPCRNCGANLGGRYCASCGQAADVHVASLHELISDLLDDLFSFDSRVWRSFLPLVFKPGYLTVDYLAGRRARYIPPFRMYLMISLVFFALSSLLGDEIVVNGGEVGAEQLSDERREVLEAGRQDVEAALQELARLSERVRSESEARAGEGDAAVAPTSPEALTTSEATSAGTAEFDLCDSLQNALPSAWQQLVDACNKIAAEGGAEALVSELRDNVPMMMFLFIPLVALSMKLLYPLAKRKYIEHLLFVLHFHAFFFLFATIGILIENLVELAPVLRSGMQILVTVGSIYLMVYLFAAMRRVYRQGWLATSIKYILLAIGYAATLLVSFALTLGYTAINL